MQKRIDHLRQRWLRHPSFLVDHLQRHPQPSILLRAQLPTERCLRDRSQEAQRPLPTTSRAKRVQPDLSTGNEGYRLHAERLRQRPILTLDVEYPCLPTEDRLAV